MKTCCEEPDLNINLIRDYWETKFPSKILSSCSLKGNVIYDITQNCSLQQPPIQYRTEFIKQVIKHLESGESGEEDTSQWYDLLEDLSKCVQSEPFYRLYDVGLPKENGLVCPIKIYEEQSAFVKDGSTGFVTWIASIELAKWLTLSQLSFTSPNAKDAETTEEEEENCCYCSWGFELGCGTGLLAVALLKKFPNLKYYTATDVSEGVLRQCESNVLTNKLSAKVQVKKLDWIQDLDKIAECFQSISGQSSTPGVLFGADVIFDTSVVEYLRKIIQSFLVRNGNRVFLSSAIRNQSTFDTFCNEIRENNLEIDVVHAWESLDCGKGVILEIKKDMFTITHEI